MKIEPVGFISPEYLQNPFNQSVGLDWVPVWNKPHGIATEKVYTETQMRQLGEACAARCEHTPKMQAYGNNRAVQDECAAEIRELIKELLP